MKMLVIDLSHWDPASDYSAVKNAGVIGVIYKASQGQSAIDPTYNSQKNAAKAAGLKWGSYHFGDSSDISSQVNNFLTHAQPASDELFCLDWEDNGSTTMSAAMAKAWIEGVESKLGRTTQCVLYSGNTAKEALGSTVDPFFGARRLWLAQYSSIPSVQASWTTYWLWQYSDKGACPGLTVPTCDVSTYFGTTVSLITEWSNGIDDSSVPVVTVSISAPPGVKVNVVTN
jgi:GH25 family lysozyme M1 (1,4-beta-N-acetylmuramidase)